jgi:hypothetical protein
MEVNSQLHGPANLPLRNRPLYPLDRRLDGAVNRSGRSEE